MTRPSIVLLVALVAVASAAQPPKVTNNCQACRSTVSFVRQLNSTTHRQDYKNVVEKFCEQYYPASTDYQTGPCPMFADGFFYIIDNIDPVTHCDEIGMCGPSQLPSDDMHDYLQATNDNSVMRTDDGPICQYCISLLEQVKASLSNPRVVKEIKERTEAFCEFLAVVNEDKECKQIIDRYLDLAVQTIKYLDSRLYCRSISLCPAKRRGPLNGKFERQLPTLADFNNFGIETSVSIGSTRVTPARARPSTGGKARGECMLCKTVVKGMFEFLRENKTEANIVDGLNKICQLIYPTPGPSLDQCRGLVKAYTKELVELLIDETDPDIICALIGMCVYESTPSVALKSLPDLSQLISSMDTDVPLNSPRSCIECKMFISYVKDEIQNPQSEEEVKQWLLNNLCKTLPSDNLQMTCKTMVQTYAPVFFRAIAGDLNPQTACVELGACKPRSLVQILNLASSSWVEQPYMPRPQDQRCNRCVDIVVRIDDYLSNHSPGQDIYSLMGVCDNFAGTKMKHQCVNMIQQNGLDIIQNIPTMENPRQLCGQIALC